jgi:hypothetical protein
MKSIDESGVKQFQSVNRACREHAMDKDSNIGNRKDSARPGNSPEYKAVGGERADSK